MRVVVCADFGSTFTKALLVSLDDAAVLASAEHRTTTGSDVLDGLGACVADLARTHPSVTGAPVLACSSAGGGLRIAVVGNEELVTAEAGRRVALSSGGHVVHVGAGGLDRGPDGGPDGPRLAALRDARPDVVLLVGGTDGGNAAVLLGAADVLAGAGWPGPVVVAGNADVAGDVATALAGAGVAHEVAANVVPQIGVLEPASARAAVRAVFLRHVIGGKHLSASPAFAEMLLGPTPDIVLTGVEALAAAAGDVAVVDVGGATTDVHSVVEVDPEDGRLHRQVVGPARVRRTVEGDLGVRWSARTSVDLGRREGLLDDAAYAALAEPARRRADDPGLVPVDADATADDHALAGVAIRLALRRHAGRQRVVLGPEGRVVERTGRDLREVDLLVGSGGVLRHARRDAAERLIRTATGANVPGGWLLPRAPRVAVDRAYVLAATGLLAPDHPDVAAALLHTHLLDPRPPR